MVDEVSVLLAHIELVHGSSVIAESALRDIETVKINDLPDAHKMSTNRLNNPCLDYPVLKRLGCGSFSLPHFFRDMSYWFATYIPE